MNEFNHQFEGLTDDQRQNRYLRLAQACLKHYPVADGEISFIAHNAGVTYRIETPPGKQSFLLKIDQFIGEEANLAPTETLRSGLTWLDAIARQTNLVVQQPVPNHAGDFLTLVAFDDLHEPFYCSLQHWIDGKHPRDPSPAQAYQIGRMMAQLHVHGSQWTEGKTLEALEYDEAWLVGRLDAFAKVKNLAILSDSEWATVEQAIERIYTIMQALGKESSVWGAIHSDLHHQNILVCGDEFRPIDFGNLIRGHYGFDLGVTLYHLMYLQGAARQSLVEGYRTVREIGSLPDLTLEAFLCADALANLAFNVNLPDQRTSDLFIRNVREFATSFCRKLVDHTPFALL